MENVQDVYFNPSHDRCLFITNNSRIEYFEEKVKI